MWKGDEKGREEEKERAQYGREGEREGNGMQDGVGQGCVGVCNGVRGVRGGGVFRVSKLRAAFVFVTSGGETMWIYRIMSASIHHHHHHHPSSTSHTHPQYNKEYSSLALK